jgi:glycosyltransferase involved in cell wall biosynthesis
MKIVITGFFGFPNGMGETARALAYVRGLTKCGAEVKVICVKPSEPAVGEMLNTEVSGVYRGSHFQYTCGTTRVAKNKIRAAWLYFKGLSGLVFAVGKAARSDEKCVMLGFTGDSPSLFMTCLFAARIFGVKLIAERTEFPLIYRKNTLRNRFIGWFNRRFLYPRLNGLIVISRYLEQYFRKMLGSQARILRIPIMVESDLWADAGSVQRSPVFTIAYCGNLDHLGEVDDLIKAFVDVSQRRRSLRLLIIGGGSRLAVLKRQTELVSLEGSIEFTGLLPRPKIVEKLYESNLLVLPRRAGTFSSFGFPTKLGEYLATGKPVIATSTGDIPLYLKDRESAYLVQPGDVKALADRIQEVITHYETAIQIGQAGQRVAAQYFDIEPNCRRVISFINELWVGAKNL